jgi:ABC-type glycerol-3-phosphate transport system substrate-binding protein
MDNTDNKPPETPEPIFENVVDEKFPGAYDSMMAPEEVVDDAATLDDVAYNPTPTGFAPKNSDGKMQRYIFIGAIVIFFVGIFFVLYSIFKPKTTASNKSTTPVKLTIWGLWEDEEQFAQIIDNYKKVKPNVTISYKKMAITDYLSLVKNRSKNGQGPDIFRFHNTWIPNLIGQGQPVLAAAPSTIFSKQEFDKTFYKVASDDLTVGQQVYGVPLYIDGLVLLYNKKILNQIGITLVPQNLELIGSFLDVVSRATVKNAAGACSTFA